jgi:Bacterial Ig-like domain (group 2)
MQVGANQFSGLRAEIKINNGPAQFVALDKSEVSLPLQNICPGDNKVDYRLFVNAQALTDGQTSTFAYLPADAFSLSGQPTTLVAGSEVTLSLQLKEKLPYSCEPIVTVSGDAVVTATNPVVEGTGAQRIVKVLVKGLTEGKGILKLNAVIGASSATVDLPITVGSAQDAPAITGVTVAPNPLSLQVDQVQKLDVGLTGTGDFNRQLLFKSDDVTVAAVSADGMVSAVKAGKTVINIVPVGAPDKAIKLPVEVKAAPTFDITSSASGLTLVAGTQGSVTVNLVAQNGYAKSPSLSVSAQGVQVSAAASTLSGSGVAINIAAPTGLGAGTYTVVIKVNDAELGLERTISLPVQVSAASTPPGPGPKPTDKEAPTISNVLPESGAIISTSSVLVQAAVKDNQAVSSVSMQITSLGLNVPMQLQGTDSYAATWDLSKLESGAYVMEIVATDSAGNSSRAAVPIDVSRAGTGLTLRRRFQFSGLLPTSSVATDASGAFGFVGVGGSVYRLDLNTGSSEVWYTASGTVRHLVQAGGKIYAATAGGEVYAIDPQSKSASGGTVPGGISSGLVVSGGQVYVGGSGGLFNVTEGRINAVSGGAISSLSADQSGVYALDATGLLVSYTSSGTVISRQPSQNLRWIQASGGGVFGADRYMTDQYTRYEGGSLKMSAGRVSPAPTASPSFLMQMGASLLMGDAGGVLTDVSQSKTLSLNGSLNYVPQSYNGVIYLSTNNYTLYAVSQVGGQWQVAAKMSGIGLATAGATVGADGTVYYVGFNGVYAYKPL